VIGNTTAEIALASAALCRAGARVVASRPDLAILVDAKASAPRSLAKRVPLIAIVPRRHKAGALAAGVDAAYTRPLGWKAYRRLVERILVEWASPRRASSRR
jgi:hypothetical protein